MLIPCSRAQVVVAEPGIRLERQTPGSMVWDEHGGTFILRVDDLTATEVPGGQSETGIILEIPLSCREELIGSLEEFAAQQELPQSPPPGPELLEVAVLAACHLPGQNLFVFAEEPRLWVKKRGETVEIAVTGLFKARRVPCRETDLVIHLTKAAMARLVSSVLSLARGDL
jgi:hypothetical protein